MFGLVSSALLYRGVSEGRWEPGALGPTSSSRANYVPSSVSLAGSFLIAMSFLIVSPLFYIVPKLAFLKKSRLHRKNMARCLHYPT